MNTQRKNVINIYDLALWLNLGLLQFGFSVLATEASAGLRKYICIFSIGLSLILCLRSLSRRRSQTFGFVVILISIMATFMGIINGADSTGIVLDLTVSLSAICAIELCFVSEVAIEKYLKFIAWSAIIMSLAAWLMNPISLANILSRAETWSGLYYCTCMFWAAPFMLLYSFNKQKHMKLAIAYFVISAFINVLFLKRQFIVEAVATVLMLLYYVLVKEKKFSKVIKLIIIVSLLLLCLYFTFEVVLKLDISPIIERITERFDESEETGFVRFEESTNYFNSTDLLDVLLGKGFGVSHGGLGKENTALHIGIGNIILKYGLLALLLFVVLVLGFVRKFLSRKNQGPLIESLKLISIVNIIEFCLLSNFWLTTPIFCWLIFGIIACRFRQPETLCEEVY